MRWKTCWMNGRDSRRAPADFSMFNDFAIQLSIISFIKSCQAHRYTLASMGGNKSGSIHTLGEIRWSGKLAHPHPHPHLHPHMGHIQFASFASPPARISDLSHLGPLQTKWLIHVVASGGVPLLTATPPLAGLCHSPLATVFSMGTGFVSFSSFIRSIGRRCRCWYWGLCYYIHPHLIPSSCSSGQCEKKLKTNATNLGNGREINE